MEKKPRQVTDNVHGTIYLSDMESRLIATPYFYRLHDVYQSSTVYMTFPSNRTKRYEHSLGAMELASQMFFSAIANADVSVRKDMMDSLDTCVEKIIDKIIDEDIKDVKYCSGDRVREYMQAIFLEDRKRAELVRKSIDKSMENRILADSALEHFVVCFFEDAMKTPKEDNNVQTVAKYMFLYQCTLEAVRIAALFHDVGHPPYSHIIEEVLDELYEQCLIEKSNEYKEFEKKKAEKLIRSLSKFKLSEGKTNIALKERGLTSFLLIDNKFENKDAKSYLHEQIGIGMLELAIESVFPNMLENAFDFFQDAEYRIGVSIYYITVIEFTLAILLEKNQIFAFLHRIIDGPFDADRLDYIVRDSQNSGVDWGKIPYKRIVESAKLMHVDKKDKNSPLIIAYPEKIADDIEDVLVTRYKIYVRINFHHRCIKTATLMQEAVKELALNYLRTPEDKESISDGIANLWKALGDSLNKQELKTIQWNDSWLITVLYEVLVSLSNKATSSKLEKNGICSAKDIERIKNLLEEILLNQKHYMSLLKRRSDIEKLIGEILNATDIEKKLPLLKERERQKYYNEEEGEEKQKAKESLLRIKKLDNARKRGEFSLLNTVLPTSTCICDIIKNTLEKAVKDKSIVDFYVIENLGRDKSGLPDPKKKDKNIYFYDAQNDIKPYNRQMLLASQIAVLKLTCPEFHVYVNFGCECGKETLDNIRLSLAEAIAKELQERFYELFPSMESQGL